MEQNRTTNALEELVRLASLLHERVLTMWAEERKSGLMNPHLDTAIRTQKELLLSIQELLFDLGLEDCKRHTPWAHIITVEKRSAEVARHVESFTEAEKILEKRLGKKGQPDAHLKERATEAEIRQPGDCNGTVNRAEPLAAVSSAELVQGASVLEELVKLANIQDQRVLALSAEENKSGFMNPRLDSATRLYKELLLSVQAMTFDLGLDEYKRRTPREQVAEYWEQEQQHEMQTYEAFKAAAELLRPHFAKSQVRKAASSTDADNVS